MLDDLNKVIPRWEWRYFTVDPVELLPVFRGIEPVAEQTTQHTYLISQNPALNMKFRDGHLDVKYLVETSSAGFEKWKPVFKAEFPLDGAKLDQLLQIVGMDVSSDLSLGSLEDLSEQLELATLEIHKERKKYLVDDVSCEHAEIKAHDKIIFTMAIEDPDPEKISSARESLGVRVSENVNYPTALKKFYKSIIG